MYTTHSCPRFFLYALCERDSKNENPGSSNLGIQHLCELYTTKNSCEEWKWNKNIYFTHKKVQREETAVVRWVERKKTTRKAMWKTSISFNQQKGGKYIEEFSTLGNIFGTAMTIVNKRRQGRRSLSGEGWWSFMNFTFFFPLYIL